MILWPSTCSWCERQFFLGSARASRAVAGALAGKWVSAEQLFTALALFCICRAARRERRAAQARRLRFPNFSRSGT